MRKFAALHTESMDANLPVDVKLSMDYGSSKITAAYMIKGHEGEPEVLSYTPDVFLPNHRTASDELAATVSVRSKEADPGYTVGESDGTLDTKFFTSLKLTLDDSAGAKAFNDRFKQALETLNSERRSAGLEDVTLDRLLQAPFNRVLKQIRGVIEKKFPGKEFTIQLWVGHPGNRSIGSKYQLRELAIRAGKEEGISLTVSLINEARAAFARIIDWHLVRVTPH